RACQLVCACGHCGSAFIDESLKSIQVQALWFDPEQITGRLADQHLVCRPGTMLGFQDLPELRHIDLEAVGRGVRRFIGPDEVDKMKTLYRVATRTLLVVLPVLYVVVATAGTGHP